MSSLLQLTLAIAPAVAASLLLSKIRFPWEAKKHASERTELLTLLARDVKTIKKILAINIAAVNEGRACPVTSLPLANWKRLKTDARLNKYADERIFREMIKQFKMWEKGGLKLTAN